MARSRNGITQETIVEIREFVASYIATRKRQEILSVKGLFEFNPQKFRQYATDGISQRTTWINRIKKGAKKYNRTSSREMPNWEEVMSVQTSLKKHPKVIPAEDFDDEELELPVQTQLKKAVTKKDQINAIPVPTSTDQISDTTVNQPSIASDSVEIRHVANQTSGTLGSVDTPPVVSQTLNASESVTTLPAVIQSSSASESVTTSPVVIQSLNSSENSDIASVDKKALSTSSAAEVVSSPENQALSMSEIMDQLRVASTHTDQLSTIALPLTVENMSVEQASTLNESDMEPNTIAPLIIEERALSINQPSNIVSVKPVKTTIVEPYGVSDPIETITTVSTLESLNTVSQIPADLPLFANSTMDILTGVTEPINPELNTLISRLTTGLKRPVGRPRTKSKDSNPAGVIISVEKSASRPSRSGSSPKPFTTTSKSFKASKPTDKPVKTAKPRLATPISIPHKIATPISVPSRLPTPDTAPSLVSTPNHAPNSVLTSNGVLSFSSTCNHVASLKLTPDSAKDTLSVAQNVQSKAPKANNNRFKAFKMDRNPFTNTAPDQPPEPRFNWIFPSQSTTPPTDTNENICTCSESSFPPSTTACAAVKSTSTPVEHTCVSVENTFESIQNTHVPLENTYVPVESTFAPIENTHVLVRNTFPAKTTSALIDHNEPVIETTCALTKPASVPIVKDKWDKSLPILKPDGTISAALLTKYLKRLKYPTPLAQINRDFVVSTSPNDRARESTTLDTTESLEDRSCEIEDATIASAFGREESEISFKDYQTTPCTEDFSSVQNIYKQIHKKDKLMLSTGTVVEDKMALVAQLCRREHAVHSMILDLEDGLWEDEANFKTEEKDEILDMTHNEFLYRPDTTLSRVFNLLKGKTTFNELYDAIQCIEAHPRKTLGLYWIKETLMSSIRLFTNSHSISLSDFSDEADMFSRVFGFLENIKYVLNLSAVKGAPGSARRNQKPDNDFKGLTLKYNSMELFYVAGEIQGKSIHDTEYKNERYLRMPKILRDFLYESVNKYPHNKSSIKPVGYIINGFAITGMYQECLSGSVTLIKESARLQFPESLSEFVVKIKPIIHLVYNSIRIMEKNIKACNADNNCYSLGKRKCLITPTYSTKRPKTTL